MTGRDLGGQYAGFLSRAVGLFLDYVILGAIVAVTGFLAMVVFNAFHLDLTTCAEATVFVSLGTLACRAGSWLLLFFAITIGPFYFVVFWSLTGQTIGQRVMGLRVVRLNGRRIGLFASFLRWIGYQLCIATLGLGFLWVLVDDRRMGWHDKLGRTCVIYAWKARQNERFIDKVSRRLRRDRRAVPAEAVERGQPDVAQDMPAS